MAPFGGTGASVPAKDDTVSDGYHHTISTVVLSSINESLPYPIRDHVPPVGDIFIVGQGGDDDFDVVLDLRG